MKHQVISATEFKAKCLALLDDVNEKGHSITVTKRGRPVATLQPVKKKAWRDPTGILAGKFDLPDNLESLDTSHLWDVVRNPNDWGV